VNPKKRKAFFIRDKMDILAQACANKEIRVTEAAKLGIVPSTLNTTVRNKTDNEKCYAQYGRFSGQMKSPNQPPFQDLESLLVAWF
jgi:NADP-dependent 3-hydroxy acid dehydrogenase YdfG